MMLEKREIPDQNLCHAFVIPFMCTPTGYSALLSVVRIACLLRTKVLLRG